jgi:hypothetical protein
LYRPRRRGDAEMGDGPLDQLDQLEVAVE